MEELDMTFNPDILVNRMQLVLQLLSFISDNELDSNEYDTTYKAIDLLFDSVDIQEPMPQFEGNITPIN